MYLSFYGFHEEPFRLTPDPRFLHLAEPHRDALLKILEGVGYRKGLVLAVGPVGTGKTTLLHTAQHMLKNKLGGQLASAFLVNPALTRDEFLEAVLDEFGVACASSSKPRRLEALHDFLLSVQERQGTAVLIVDEAHLLCTDLLEEIRLLTNIDAYHNKLLQVLLCGQPELGSIMARPELAAMRQRVAAVAKLRPLTLSETRAYLAGRQHAAGLRGSSPFSDEFVVALFENTQGVPRLINLICDHALMIGFKAQMKTLGGELAHEAASDLSLDFCMQASGGTELGSGLQ